MVQAVQSIAAAVCGKLETETLRRQMHHRQLKGYPDDNPEHSLAHQVQTVLRVRVLHLPVGHQHGLVAEFREQGDVSTVPVPAK